MAAARKANCIARNGKHPARPGNFPHAEELRRKKQSVRFFILAHPCVHEIWNGARE